ncbi:MAG: winged helix-turn-helix domain-containing protein [Thermoanaerobaculales bacterium]|jgi:DNA-binding winged helix-turn-helix (wHTH) protein/tetratricopeptide (TPR) repeat protein|nr:winged helix-turn-helix domain-containing protein [Thermoanaerobaculales bacterium]
MRPEAAPVRRPIGPFRLGDWTVFPDRGVVESALGARHLEPRAMDALTLLAGRRGEVVTKDELIDEVWEGRIISEGTLTNTIAELRRALGDDARQPRFIETIPKRGYRLVCEVGEPEPDADHVGPAPPAVDRRRRTALLIVGVVIVAAAAIALVRSLQTPGIDPGRVLVVPFANRTGDPDLEPLAVLARDLAVGELTSSGFASALPASEGATTGDLEAVCRLARGYGAGIAITGALYLHDGDLAVQAQLVDVGEGALLYAIRPVVGSREAAGASVEAATQRVLGALATHLNAHAHSNLQARPPGFAAYREFIAGSEIWTDDLPAAIRHLERAVELDPDFTSAQLRLAMALKVADRHGEGRAILDRLDRRRAELTEFEWLWIDAFIADFEGRSQDELAALDRILEMAPTDWTVHFLISGVSLRLNRPHGAIAALTALHDADLPGFVTRHGLYAESYRRLATASHMIGDHRGELVAARDGRGRFPTDPGLMAAEARACAALADAEGLERLIAAAAVTPAAGNPARLLVVAAATAAAHGRPSEARRLAERAVIGFDEADPDGAPADDRLGLAQALVLLVDLERAQAVLTAIEAELGDRSGRLPEAVRGWLGVVAARRGDLATALAMSDRLATLDAEASSGNPSFYRGAIAAWLGHREAAIDHLREARAAGWGAFGRLHDEERGLLAPLEGVPEVDAMLGPETDR